MNSSSLRRFSSIRRCSALCFSASIDGLSAIWMKFVASCPTKIGVFLMGFAIGINYLTFGLQRYNNILKWTNVSESFFEFNFFGTKIVVRKFC